MINNLRKIKPIIGDDNAFCTMKLSQIPYGFGFESINDDFLTDYIDDLKNYYYHYDVVGETINDFKNLLNLTWNRNKEIIKKFASFKDDIEFSYDNENETTVTGSSNGNSNNTNTVTDTHIDVPISNNNDTPSSKDLNSSEYYNNYKNSNSQSIISINKDGDINRVNELIDKYRSVLDILIDTFKGCFMYMECYTY